MKIAILGAGAMGMLFGGYLARFNDVTLIDVDPSKVESVNAQGVRILEQDGSVTASTPRAVTNSAGLPCQDLVIVFVKAMFSRSALRENRALIGPDTYLATFQNGSGHEEILREFADPAHIVMGTTQHNSSVAGPATVRHGAGGPTMIGPLNGEPEGLQFIAENFTSCGLRCQVSDKIQKMIWHKMFTNVSASVLTGVFQMPLGFLLDSPDAWALTETLLREAVGVANGDGLGFDEEEVVREVRTHLEHSRGGFTSIYADLRDGRKTEVDTISGSVVRASRRNGVPAPSHEFAVHLIHALEDRHAIVPD